MRYTMVKQFSNAMIDNIFAFIFKWVDFGKMFLEFLYSFLEIWMAFFLIFYNLFMYLYYLALFFVDKGSEEGAGMFRIRGTYSKSSYVPSFELTSGPNPISGKYGVASTAKKSVDTVASTVDTATQKLSSIRGSKAGAGAKRSIIKDILNAIFKFFISLGRLLAAPFKAIIGLYDRKKMPAEAKEEEAGKSKSLIDEYIKEYEQKRK